MYVPHHFSATETKSRIIARPPAFELRMTVSSGTYVRSIIHDIGIAIGSAAHVVALIRTRQGPFALDRLNVIRADVENPSETIHRVVPWGVLDDAVKSLSAPKQENETEAVDGEMHSTWEKAILQALQ